MYNTTPLENVTNYYDIYTSINVIAGQDYLIGNLLLLSVFLVMVISLKSRDINYSILYSSLSVTILSILMATAGMVSFTIITIPATLFALSIAGFFLTS